MRPTNTVQIAHMIDFKGHRFEKDIILTCVRWVRPLTGQEY